MGMPEPSGLLLDLLEKEDYIHDSISFKMPTIGKKRFERAGIHISPYALKRTFATHSFRAGMNVIQLQGLLGHSTFEITRHYIEI